jgi:hypothetical protein
MTFDVGSPLDNIFEAPKMVIDWRDLICKWVMSYLGEQQTPSTLMPLSSITLRKQNVLHTNSKA